MREAWNKRPCSRCGHPVIDVRDRDTWATFPVEAQPEIIPAGFVLSPGENPKRNPYADRAAVYMPHLPRCQGEVHEGGEEIGDTAPEGESQEGLDLPPDKELEAPH